MKEDDDASEEEVDLKKKEDEQEARFKGKILKDFLPHFMLA